jgi:phage I-like protein
MALPRHPRNVAAASIEVAATGAAVKRVQLLPMGRIELRDGRGPFFLRDLDHARRVIEATRKAAGPTAIVIDYDHQTFFGARPGVGGTARAAGWIDPQTLSADATGIWADVEWTPAAEAALAAREYRYISPLFRFDDKTSDVVEILNAGLVNQPAITELAAAAAADLSLQETTEMDLSRIAAALGLLETATEEDVLAAIAALVDKAVAASLPPPETVAAAATALGLGDTATLSDVLAAAASQPAGAAVAAATIADLTQRVVRFETAEAERLVAAAVESGRITPAQKPFWLEQLKTNRAAAAAYLESAPVLVSPGRDPASAPANPADGLTEAERTVAAALGVKPQAFIAARKEA